MVGEKVPVVDSAEACAEDVARRLRAGGLLRGDRAEPGFLRCFVTDNTPRFAALAAHFMGMEVGEATYVSVEELYRLDPVEKPLRIAAG
jgi:glutamate racemase